jgi:hypothetical protein
MDLTMVVSRFCATHPPPKAAAPVSSKPMLFDFVGPLNEERVGNVVGIAVRTLRGTCRKR